MHGVIEIITNGKEKINNPIFREFFDEVEAAKSVSVNQSLNIEFFAKIERIARFCTNDFNLQFKIKNTLLKLVGEK